MADGSIQATIDRFRAARLAGDKEAIRRFLSPGATYEMVGAKAFAPKEAVGPTQAWAAADQLVDDFVFHDMKQLTAIIDGPRAAIVNRLEVSFRGGTAVCLEVCDLWEFDAAGKVTSIKQFVDTDLVRRMIGAPT